MRSDCLYTSSQLKFSHFSPSKIESTEACVLRSTSVSSRRRIMVPPLWRGLRGGEKKGGAPRSVGAGIQRVKNERACAAYMEKAGRRGSEADAWPGAS